MRRLSPTAPLRPPLSASPPLRCLYRLARRVADASFSVSQVYWPIPIRAASICHGLLETTGQLTYGNCRCRSWSMPIVLLVFVTSSTNTKGTSPHVLVLSHDHWLKSSNLSPLSSRRQELAAPGLHGGDDAGVYVFLYNTPDAYKSNFTLVAKSKLSSLGKPETRANTNCVQKVAKEVDEFLLECNLKLGATGLGEIRCGEPRPLASPSTCPVAKSLQTSSGR